MNKKKVPVLNHFLFFRRITTSYVTKRKKPLQQPIVSILRLDAPKKTNQLSYVYISQQQQFSSQKQTNMCRKKEQKKNWLLKYTILTKMKKNKKEKKTNEQRAIDLMVGLFLN